MVDSKPQTPPASAPQQAQEDPRIASMLEKLEAEVLKSQELNKRLEAREKQLDEDAKNAKPTGNLSAQEEASVASRHSSKVASMREALKNEEKVKMWVPLEGGEKKGTQLPVTINGLRLNVPKGVYVMLPQTVADVVSESLQQTQEATNIPQNLDNWDDDKREKLLG